MYSSNVGGPLTNYLPKLGGVTANTHEAAVNCKTQTNLTKSQGKSIWGLAYGSLMSLTHYQLKPSKASKSKDVQVHMHTSKQVCFRQAENIFSMYKRHILPKSYKHGTVFIDKILNWLLIYQH